MIEAQQMIRRRPAEKRNHHVRPETVGVLARPSRLGLVEHEHFGERDRDILEGGAEGRQHERSEIIGHGGRGGRSHRRRRRAACRNGRRATRERTPRTTRPRPRSSRRRARDSSAAPEPCIESGGVERHVAVQQGVPRGFVARETMRLQSARQMRE